MKKETYAYKRPYNRLSVSKIEVESESAILTASIVGNSQISSVGQEIGPSYDLSTDVDGNTGKTFSHEWEAGFN